MYMHMYVHYRAIDVGRKGHYLIGTQCNGVIDRLVT